MNETLCVPRFLGPEDHPWLALLLDEFLRHAGGPVIAWQARAREPLRIHSPESRRRAASDVLTALCLPPARMRHPTPEQLRERAFARAAEARRGHPHGAMDRAAILSSLQSEFALDPAELEHRLFADLGSERPLILPAQVPDPHELALLTNHAIAQGYLRSATRVELVLDGATRPVLRQILLRRLLCTVRVEGNAVHLELSGPLALFRRTTIYGRALAAVLPALRSVASFKLCAHVQRRGEAQRIRLHSGDPIFPPGIQAPRYDSRLEERFAREFLRTACDWELQREPEPIRLEDAWVFPDFALLHRLTRRRVLLEIVGFWTPEYLRTKLDRLRRAAREDLLICVDASRACAAEFAAELPNVLFYRGKVDAEAVRRSIEEALPAAPLRAGEARFAP